MQRAFSSIMKARFVPLLVLIVALFAWLPDALTYPVVAAYQQALNEGREGSVDHTGVAGWLSGVGGGLPSTPTMLTYQGFAYLQIANIKDTPATQAEAALRAAAAYYQKSLALRPTNPWSWYRLAGIQILLRVDPQVSFGSLYKAYLYGRNEQAIREPLLKYVGRLYKLLPNDLHAEYLSLMVQDIAEGREDVIKYAVVGGYWSDLEPYVTRDSQLAYATSLMPPRSANRRK